MSLTEKMHLLTDNYNNIVIIILRLPCTFRGGFSLTDVAPLSYIPDTRNPYQIKAYRTGYSNISLLLQQNKFPGFP